MKFIELLQQCDIELLMETLIDLHLEYENHFENDKENGEKVILDVVQGYGEVMSQLLNTSPSSKTSDLYVNYVEDFFEKGVYRYDVSSLNPDFVCLPAENLEAWGGDGNDQFDVPDKEKFYNINWNGYNKTFSLLGIDRADFLNGEVILADSVVEQDVSDEKILAEILWEITFYGFDEKDNQDFIEELHQYIDEITELKK